jgi:hypothetical protein
MTWTGEPCGEESPTCTGEQKVSEKANQRYWEALSQVDDSTRLEELIQPLEQPRLWRGKRVRALHPSQAEDNRLLESINRGEFTNPWPPQPGSTTMALRYPGKN